MQKKTQNIVPLSQLLASTLLEKGILSLDQLDVAFKERQLQGISIEECLINLGFISETVLAEALSSVSGYHKMNLKNAQTVDLQRNILLHFPVTMPIMGCNV